MLKYQDAHVIDNLNPRIHNWFLFSSPDSIRFLFQLQSCLRTTQFILSIHNCIMSETSNPTVPEDVEASAHNEAENLDNVEPNDSPEPKETEQQNEAQQEEKSENTKSNNPLKEKTSATPTTISPPTITVDESTNDEPESGENEDEEDDVESNLSVSKPRRSKRSHSIALSVSNISTTGQQTVSSIVFIKNAFESISKHKAVTKNPTLSSSVTKALSEY